MATKFASYSGYHYAGNNPVMLNDPTGADFTVIVPDYYNPGHYQVITQKVDEPVCLSCRSSQAADEYKEFLRESQAFFDDAARQRAADAATLQWVQNIFNSVPAGQNRLITPNGNASNGYWSEYLTSYIDTDGQFTIESGTSFVPAQLGKPEQEIKDFYFKNFGWSQGLADIKVGAPPNFFIDEQGLISDGNKSVLARTIPGKNNTSTIYVSPLLSRATEKWLFGILGHETVHVYDNFKHGYDTSGASEYNAWSWSIQWAKAIGDPLAETDALNARDRFKANQNANFNYLEYGLPNVPVTP